MQLLCLGLNHLNASLERRERCNYSPSALTTALARFGCGGPDRPAGLAELAILSTCNRLELYAVATGMAPDELPGEAAFAPLVDFVAETRGLPAAEIAGWFYRLAGQPAVEHLCRVAAGLDSMILGEPQILGQVIEAYQEAQGQAAAGPVLSALFRTAIRAGKRARTETGISRNPATVSSVAVRLAASAVPELPLAHVVVIGAGEMAELAVEALRARGVRRITVINRTRARAEQLAARWGAPALSFEHLPAALSQADIVFSSTDAPHFIVTHEVAASAISQRPDRPLVFIDIAVPRDVDPEVARLPGVRYFDLDGLQNSLNGSLAERQQEVPHVEAIVAQEAQAFLHWLHGLEVTPLIADLRARAEAICRTEVDRTLRRLPQLEAAERQHIEKLAAAVASKLLHAPTERLKAEAGNGHGAYYAAAARLLFGLEE